MFVFMLTLELDYLIRAYEIDPYDAYVCFMIAQAFFGRAMNRQSDNRNYQIAQVSYDLLSLEDQADTAGVGFHDQVSEIGLEGRTTSSRRGRV